MSLCPPLCLPVGLSFCPSPFLHSGSKQRTQIKAIIRTIHGSKQQAHRFIRMLFCWYIDFSSCAAQLSIRLTLPVDLFTWVLPLKSPLADSESGPAWLKVCGHVNITPICQSRRYWYEIGPSFAAAIWNMAAWICFHSTINPWCTNLGELFLWALLCSLLCWDRKRPSNCCHKFLSTQLPKVSLYIHIRHTVKLICWGLCLLCNSNIISLRQIQMMQVNLTSIHKCNGLRVLGSKCWGSYLRNDRWMWNDCTVNINNDHHCQTSLQIWSL